MVRFPDNSLNLSNTITYPNIKTVTSINLGINDSSKMYCEKGVTYGPFKWTYMSLEFELTSTQNLVALGFKTVNSKHTNGDVSYTD